jgi:hypothetical protein
MYADTCDGFAAWLASPKGCVCSEQCCCRCGFCLGGQISSNSRHVCQSTFRRLPCHQLGACMPHLQTRARIRIVRKYVVYSSFSRLANHGRSATWRTEMTPRNRLGRCAGCGGAVHRTDHSKAAEGQHNPEQPPEDHTDGCFLVFTMPCSICQGSTCATSSVAPAPACCCVGSCACGIGCC